MIRAFVAVPLPEPVMGDLIAAQAGLPAGRPVPPENLHLTLAFLGEHPEPVIEDVHYALARIQATPFSLVLAGLGLFGGDRPRLLHAEVQPEPALKHLRAKVLQAARSAGLDLGHERFRPHVTLARMGSGLRGEEAARMLAFAEQGAGFRSGPFAVERIELMRSTLARSGAIYDELAAYPLVENRPD